MRTHGCKRLLSTNPNSVNPRVYASHLQAVSSLRRQKQIRSSDLTCSSVFLCRKNIIWQPFLGLAFLATEIRVTTYPSGFIWLRFPLRRNATRMKPQVGVFDCGLSIYYYIAVHFSVTISPTYPSPKERLGFPRATHRHDTFLKYLAPHSKPPPWLAKRHTRIV